MSYSCPIFDGTCDVYDHSIMIIILSVVGMVTAFIVMTASGKSFFFQLALQPFLHAGNYYPWFLLLTTDQLTSSCQFDLQASCGCSWCLSHLFTPTLVMLLQQLSTANWLSISRTTGIWESPTVHPLVVEALGGWSFTGSCTITAIAQKLSLHSGLEDKEVTCHLFQRLSVSLWRRNMTWLAWHDQCYMTWQ